MKNLSSKKKQSAEQKEKYFRFSIFKMLSLEARNMSLEENFFLIFIVALVSIIIVAFTSENLIPFFRSFFT